jgi:hypothetical protein
MTQIGDVHAIGQTGSGNGDTQIALHRLGRQRGRGWGEGRGGLHTRGTTYLIGDVADVFPFDRDMIVQPYFKAIFEEELNSWHRRESDWPSSRTYATLVAWFEVEVHSMVLDLEGRRLIRTESYY